MREKWRGTLSDDFAVTRAMKGRRARYLFCSSGVDRVGRRLLAARHDRIHKPPDEDHASHTHRHLWLNSHISVPSIFNAVMIASLDDHYLQRAKRSATFSSRSRTFMTGFGFQHRKSWLRLKAVELVLGDRWPQVKRQWLIAKYALAVVAGAVSYQLRRRDRFTANDMAWDQVRIEIAHRNCHHYGLKAVTHSCTERARSDSMTRSSINQRFDPNDGSSTAVHFQNCRRAGRTVTILRLTDCTTSLIVYRQRSRYDRQSAPCMVGGNSVFWRAIVFMLFLGWLVDLLLGIIAVGHRRRHRSRFDHWFYPVFPHYLADIRIEDDRCPPNIRCFQSRENRRSGMTVLTGLN